MKTETSDLRMPADKFDRIMRKALQAKPPAKASKTAAVKNVRRTPARRGEK